MKPFGLYLERPLPIGSPIGANPTCEECRGDGGVFAGPGGAPDCGPDACTTCYPWRSK